MCPRGKRSEGFLFGGGTNTLVLMRVIVIVIVHLYINSMGHSIYRIKGNFCPPLRCACMVDRLGKVLSTLRLIMFQANYV